MWTPRVQQWAAQASMARVAHVFDHACVLEDAAGSLVFVVAAAIGPGPLNLVVSDPSPGFAHWLSPQTAVTCTRTHLWLGNTAVEMTSAGLWSPRPLWHTLVSVDWSRWHMLFPHLANDCGDCGFLPVVRPAVDTAVSALHTALHTADDDLAAQAAHQLAGLGLGLTPAGDDVLSGALLAAWALRPPVCAARFGQIVFRVAAPRTTRLSGAWLQAAARGEAAAAWHGLVAALAAGEETAVVHAIDHIRAAGHTSGTDALMGFAAMLPA